MYYRVFVVWNGHAFSWLEIAEENSLCFLLRSTLVDVELSDLVQRLSSIGEYVLGSYGQDALVVL